MNYSLTILLVAILALGHQVRAFNMTKSTTSGYVTVRPNAHMFYWMYYAAYYTGTDYVTIEHTETKPIVLWLQGGPGGSSTGFGNFELIGPLATDLSVRNSSWLEFANLLFVDNPVGTGFSYVDDESAYASDNEMIGRDLTTLVIEFMAKNRKFESTPFYIFSESYGGKMAVGFARALLQAIADGQVQCNFQGIVLGDSWISPIDSVKSWPEYLRSFSLIDDLEFHNLSGEVQKLQWMMNSTQYYQATLQWARLEDLISKFSSYADFYYVLRHKFYGLEKLIDRNAENFASRMTSRMANVDLDGLMNSDIRKMLKIPDKIIWGGQANAVFAHLRNDFMRSVVPELNDLILQQPNLKVVVYNGQLDLIVTTLGTSRWLSTLHSLDAFKTTPKQAWTSCTDGRLLGFRKRYANLDFYTVLNAGHMVPKDVPEAGLNILRNTIEV